MLCAVDFNNQLGRVIAKIGNIGADRRLLPELKPMAIELAQQIPEFSFGGALLAPHAAGAFAH
jgi:hypothetical protein